MPFYLVAAHPELATDCVQIWATPLSTRAAAAAHAQRVSEQCEIVEAPDLLEAIQQVRTQRTTG